MDARVIRAGWVITPGARQGVDVLPGAVVAIRGSRIEFVGDEQGLPPGWEHVPRLDARDDIVMPGLVNTHNHAAMTLLRGYADDLRLMEWLQVKIWPAEAHLTADDVYWGTMLAAAEQIHAGITAFADMYFFMDEAATAVDQAGMRAQLSRGMVSVAPGGDRALAEAVKLFEDWDGHDDDRITVALGPHAPYTNHDGFIAEVLAEARRLEAPIHIHLAETAEEIAQIQEQRGMSPIRWAVESGLADRPLLAAHCVHVDDDDIRLLAEHKVGVAHNPISNAKLASGIAPVPAMLRAGVCVGLGTDGACSTNHLNLFEEMRLAAWLAKLNSGDARVLPAETVLRMATVDGARVMGYHDVGRIAEGYRADLVILDARASHLAPRHDIVSLAVYSAQTGDVRTVFIHGRPVMVDRQLQTIDEERARAECMERGLRLAREAAAG